MNNHTDLLNVIALKINAKSYLEIGTNNCKNFNSIMVAHKVGIDPDTNSPCAIHKTSDEYFKDNNETFDLIFIDGLHHADQVKRDIINAWNCLAEKGVIVVHDCGPSEEKYTYVPRQSKIWNGDVYKAISSLHHFTKFTIDFDYGCCILRKNPRELKWDKNFPRWEEFEQNRKELLNMVDIETGLKEIESWI